MVKVVDANIFTSTADVLCQAVNCRGVMAAGLAKQIREQAPHVFDEYRRFCNSISNKQDLLGIVQFIPFLPDTSLEKKGANHLHPRFYANLFTQLDCGGDPNVVYTRYRAVDACFRQLAALPENVSVAMPYKMCCGLANGDWSLISKLLRKYFQSSSRDVRLYRIGGGVRV